MISVEEAFAHNDERRSAGPEFAGLCVLDPKICGPAEVRVLGRRLPDVLDELPSSVLPGIMDAPKVDLARATILSSCGRNGMLRAVRYLGQLVTLKKLFVDSGFNRWLDKAVINALVEAAGRVVLAGGAAFRLAHGASLVGTDLDFFVCDPTVSDDYAISLLKRHGLIRESVHIGKGTLTSFCAGVQVQLILRRYPTMSVLLHSFDLPSSMVAFDGVQLYFTQLGAHASRELINIVDPQHRSLTYEKRLARYFALGVDIAIPNFDHGRLAEGVVVELPHFSFKVVKVRPGAALVSGFAGNDEATRQAVETSADPVFCENYSLCSKALASNIKTLQSGGEEYIIPGMIDLNLINYFSPADLFGRYANINLNYYTPRRIGKVLDVIGEFLSEEDRANLRACAKLPERYCIDLAKLKNRLLSSIPEASTAPIDWWIRDDPGRQYNSSRNPSIKTMREYLGDFYCGEPAAVDHANRFSNQSEVLRLFGLTALREVCIDYDEAGRYAKEAPSVDAMILDEPSVPATGPEHVAELAAQVVQPLADASDEGDSSSDDSMDSADGNGSDDEPADCPPSSSRGFLSRVSNLFASFLKRR